MSKLFAMYAAKTLDAQNVGQTMESLAQPAKYLPAQIAHPGMYASVATNSSVMTAAISNLPRTDGRSVTLVSLFGSNAFQRTLSAPAAVVRAATFGFAMSVIDVFALDVQVCHPIEQCESSSAMLAAQPRP